MGPNPMIGVLPYKKRKQREHYRMMGAEMDVSTSQCMLRTAGNHQKLEDRQGGVLL